MERVVKQKLHGTKPHTFDDVIYERESQKEIADNFYPETIRDVKDIDMVTWRRDATKGEDISDGSIQTTTKNVKVDDHYVPIRIYQSQSPNKKAVLFIHGGAFAIGSILTKDAQCKYLAQVSNATVIAVDYRLAPENPFPCGLEDCLGVLRWMKKMPFEKIIIGGDSAGGNLSAVCCLEEQIDLVFLIYAALDLAPAEETEYHWDYSLYEMDKDQENVIKNRLLRFKTGSKEMMALYLKEGEDYHNPRISPYYSDALNKFPRCLFINSEYDYYYPNCVEFAKKLEENNVPCKEIFYEGMDHGFFDRLGTIEQTKDCIEEIAKEIIAL